MYSYLVSAIILINIKNICYLKYDYGSTVYARDESGCMYAPERKMDWVHAIAKTRVQADGHADGVVQAFVTAVQLRAQ